MFLEQRLMQFDSYMQDDLIDQVEVFEING